jgi:hypothetical protein
MRVEAINFLAKTAIWGLAGVAGYGFGLNPGIVSALGVTITSGLAGGMGDLDVRTLVRRRISGRLERKWRGMLRSL